MFSCCRMSRPPSMVMSWGRASMSSLVKTLRGFAGDLACGSGAAVAGLAGACGQFAVQGAGAGLLCVADAALAGSGDCAEADSPAVKKTSTKARMWRRTERILLTHSHLHFIAWRSRTAQRSHIVTVNDISGAGRRSRLRKFNTTRGTAEQGSTRFGVSSTEP